MSFEDRGHGDFFFTSHGHEQLIHRNRPGNDHAKPSGNGINAQALQRLGHLLEEYLTPPYFAPPRTLIVRGVASALRAGQPQLDQHSQLDPVTLEINNKNNGLC